MSAITICLKPTGTKTLVPLIWIRKKGLEKRLFLF